METQPRNPKANFVLGRVLSNSLKPLNKLVVQVYDRDMRSEELLAETVTDNEGRYRVSWTHSQLEGRGRKTADISVKIFSRDKKALLFSSPTKDVRFNASAREEINIKLTESFKFDQDEYSYLQQEVTFLANDVQIQDLQEGREFQDVTFISKELAVTELKVEHLIVAHKLQAYSQIDAPFFYANLRQNSLLNKSLNIPASVGISDDIQTLLYEAALTDPQVIKQAIENAVADNLVPAEVLQTADKHIDALTRYREAAKEYFDKEHPKKAFDSINRFVKTGGIGKVEELLKLAQQDVNSFFAAVNNPESFDSVYIKNEFESTSSNPISLNTELSRIFKSREINNPEDVKKLARLNKSEWVRELSGDKTLSDNQTTAIGSYASALARKMENEFPTIAFFAQLEREKEPVFKNHEQIASLLSNDYNFDFKRDSVESYLKKKNLGESEKQSVTEELKSIQRVFKLVPHYSKTLGLYKQNIHSAQSIVSAGEKRFVNEIGRDAGLTSHEAKKIYRKAEDINTASMMIVGELQDSMQAMEIASIETSSLAPKLASLSKDFPNLKTLFKLADNCVCEHCRSVYSPAAYLVEILQYLDKRSVADLTALPPVTANLAKDVLFKRRPDLGEIDLNCENANTPLKYIDLACEILEEAIAPSEGLAYTGDLSSGGGNLTGKISTGLLNVIKTAGWPITDQAQIFATEVTSGSSDTLPHYLRDKKLVCKITHESGNTFKVKRLRQTLSTAEELAAAPEYINPDAYNILKSQNYAFKLPFDLNHVEAKAYLKRFDLPRAELMQNFKSGSSPSEIQIAAEKLGLTDAEQKLITQAKPTIAEQQLIWNAPMEWDEPAVSGNVVAYMQRVDHFLTKTGISYKELDLLLQLVFINPEGKLYIKHEYDPLMPGQDPDERIISCDTSRKFIAHLDEVYLDRIHRFLRLQKKTKIKFEILDEIITQTKLGNKDLEKSLICFAEILQISEISGIRIDEIIGFYDHIPHLPLNTSHTPLYHQIFLNKAKNGFADERLLPEKIDGTTSLTPAKTGISTSLQLKEPDLIKLLTVLTDDKLSFQNLSHLLASARLIKKLKFKTDEFIILKKLTGINIFESPGKTLQFIEAVQGFKLSPLKATELLYILRHEGEALPSIEEKIKQILEKLQQSYQAQFTLYKSKFDNNLSADEQIPVFETELSIAGQLDTSDVKMLSSYIAGNWSSTAAAKSFVDAKLAGSIDTSTIKIKIDELQAVVATKEQDINDHQTAVATLVAAKNDLKKAATPAEISSAQAAIIAAEAQLAVTLPKYNRASGKDLLSAFFTALSGAQMAIAKQKTLEENLATSFKTEPAVIEAVLKYAKLKQPAPGSLQIADILKTDSLIDTDPSHSVPVLPVINAASFADQYSALQLLNKMLGLLAGLKLNATSVAWHFEHNKQLSWLEFDVIPYAASGHVPVEYSKYAGLVQWLELEKQLRPVVNPVDAESPVSIQSLTSMLIQSVAPTREQFIHAFALLTGYDEADIDAIDAHLYPAFSLENYKDVSTWLKVIRCAENLRQLDAGVDQVKKIIAPTLSSAEAGMLRSALKSRYDEDTWLETLKEIMDTIRPQKRDALVAYILAVNPEMRDENDLYDYYLIDVEMEACMPSSRIVQAHGTVQLFVQRCLMGLEPKAAADVDNDSGWNQWKWMRNYRVWEANRKVFLYPENWIEAELRDDKSFLFKEFENEIQQNELTNYTAEQALINYLEKLDNIAFLEIVATWYQEEIKTMHVFGRTKGGDPALYYYRKFEQELYWTPWEKVELDITGDYLLAFLRNNRLCLAWPIFTEEPDPGQGATLPDQSTTTEQPVDKPRKKLKIQLAISELANNRWQPKKISKDAIKSPDVYTDQETSRAQLKFFYNRFIDHVVVFNKISQWKQTGGGGEFPEGEWQLADVMIGAFAITGCKGYPELSPIPPFPIDFIPKFVDTDLIYQRYSELDMDGTDDLSEINVHSILTGKSQNTYLDKTPGTFRITYPHQFTFIDFAALIFEYFAVLINSKRGRGIKVPLGTMLPYFKEDSDHAYVIIPGFYTKTENNMGPYSLTDTEKRTASDVFQLFKDFNSLYKKYKAMRKEKPDMNDAEALHELIIDEEFQAIAKELSKYEGFDKLYDLLISGLSNAELSTVLKEIRDANGLVYGEQFKNMYHPLVCSLRSTLYNKGLPELMKRETQLQKTNFDFNTYYKPNSELVAKTVVTNEDGYKAPSYPVEDIDFAADGSYSCYNWELFFHVPFLLATRLTANQKFEDSMSWFHYMFNPTGALKGKSPQKYWVTKPFYLNQEVDYISQRIDNLLYRIAEPEKKKELEFAITQWREKPFKPHVVARFRPVAYQKALLMKYIDNLTEWGDYLFRQDSMESIVQATQMYILADKLLGPKPSTVPSPVKPVSQTYNQLALQLDSFGNALIDIENIIPDLSALPEGGAELPPPPVTLSTLYFCIPNNEKSLAYWDKIADRLYKIRHCQNIDGIERSLALFAPPIDPGMLVKAAASGMDISAILAGLNAPNPFYRFNVLAQKATELSQELRGMGNSLLQALEKKDSESLALLRNELEMKVLNAVTDMKALQIKEAKEQIEVLKKTKKVTQERQKFYTNIKKISSQEQLNLDKLEESQDYQFQAQIVRTVAGALALIPEMHVGGSGFGGSPHVVFQIGGSALSRATSVGADILNILGSIATYEAGRASAMASYDRRYDDWGLQSLLATRELDTIEKQITAAEIRKDIAETDLKNHLLQIENSKQSDEFMRSKFSNKELYEWMISQITAVYFKSYGLAHDFAKKAERCYRFELGNDDSFISYGYWDNMKKGLQSADHLIHDLKRMEAAYLDKNKREYELTKHVSLSLLDPLAIIKLRASGVTDFDIPEALFDLDHAGNYFRRIKSVSISLPCIAGPYTSVSARLSLVSNKYRKNTNADNAAGSGYDEDPGNDERFVYNVGAIQSIVTSNAQNDAGVFELNFRDERYLPFEGTGAISSWRLELPSEIRQFDYSSISDVIIHIRYTAREGGSGLKMLASTSLKDRLAAIKQRLNAEGLHIAINMKHDLPNEWHLFKKNSSANIRIDKFRLPYMAQTLDSAIEEVVFIAKVTGNPANFELLIDESATATSLTKINHSLKLCKGSNTEIELGTPFKISSTEDLTKLEELIMVVKYSF